MSIPQSWHETRESLPEQELLSERDRLRAYVNQFLRGEIDAHTYSHLTLAELDRRQTEMHEVQAVRGGRHAAQVSYELVQPVIVPPAADVERR